MPDPTRPLTGRHICLVLATSTGGVGQHVRSVLQPLLTAGASVTVCGPAATGELFDFAAAGARFEAVEIGSGPRPVADSRAVRRLRRLTADADLVHAHGLRAGLLTVLAGGGRARPAVVTLHNAILEPPGARRRLSDLIQRRVCRSASIVLGASEDLVAGALRAGSRDARFAPVAAPALAAPTTNPQEVRRQLGATDRPLILAVGRLHPQKGYDVLLPAALRWAARQPAPLVAIAGDGPLEQSLRSQIADSKAPVLLLGRRGDIPDLFAAADLVVLPSRWEARSLVAQEALRSGTPLVATAVGGMPGLVGSAAVLVPAGDVAALDTAVQRLLDHPEQAAALAEAGLIRADSWPDQSDTAAALVAVYAELLGAPR